MHLRLHQKLIVWQRAYQLCLSIYRMTADFPSYERFGLTAQMRRSASSVPFNIAEGNSKRTKPDKMRFMNIAASSLEELHCQLLLAKDLDYMNEGQFSTLDERLRKVSFLLMRFHAALR